MVKRLCLQCGSLGFDPWVGKIPWRRKWQPTPVLFPGKFHGQRNLVDYSPWVHKDLDMTDTHFLNLYVYDNILSETFASEPG